MFIRKQGANTEQIASPQEALLDNRVLFIYGTLMGTPPRADNLCPVYAMDTMWALDQINHDPIFLVIDSPGGYVQTGLALLDTMNLIESPVVTIGRQCASMAAIVLSAGAKGQRYMYPNGSAMLHLPSGTLSGDSASLEIQAAEIKKVKDKLVELLQANGVSRTKKQIEKDIDRDAYFTAEEAIKYGFVDGIVTREVLQSIGPLVQHNIPVLSGLNFRPPTPAE